MSKYRYRKVTVDAEPFVGDVDSLGLRRLMGAKIVLLGEVTPGVVVLCTPRGPQRLYSGDYVVRLPNGEFRAYTAKEMVAEFEDVLGAAL